MAITKNEVLEMGLLIVVAVIINVIIILFQKKDFSASKKFLIIALFIGIGYIFFSPILHGIDESNHFSRIYTFFTNSETDDVGYYEIPKIIREITDNVPKKLENFSFINSKITNEVALKNLKGAKLYSPISYLQFLLPVWILGILIKTNIFTLIISSRFCGFLVYLISSIYAIRTVPKRKDFMALFCLMPIVISSGATITADILTNSSIIVLLAIWYKLYLEKRKITKKEIILIIICGILAGCTKIVYVLELFLIILLPKECFGETKSKKIKILGIIICSVLLVTLVNVFFTTGAINDSYDKMNLQKEFILKNPIKFLVILFGNILGNSKFFFSFTTNYTILQEIFIPTELPQLLYFIGLLICIYNEEADLNLSVQKVISILVIGFAIIAIMFTSLYLQFTPEITKGIIGGTEICGMQSRYYIPVMLMFLICLSSKKNTLNIDKNIPYYISLWVNVIILINVMLFEKVV